MLIGVMRQPVLDGSQLRAVLKHLANQIALRFDGLSLLEDQHRQQGIGKDEQDNQDRKHRDWPVCLLRRFALGAVDDAQLLPPRDPFASEAAHAF